MKEFQFYTGGDFESSSLELFVHNPYTGQAFAKTWQAESQHYEKAVKGSQKAARALAQMPLYERRQCLLSIASTLSAHQEPMAALIAQEAGKPWKYALGEVKRATQTLTVAAEEALRIPREYLSLDWSPDARNREGLLRYFPIGPIAGICPFNFPLNLAVHKIAPAIAAGCPIVLKPATATPLSTLFLAQMIHQAGLPAGAVSVLPMDRKTGSLLVRDDRFKLLTFTGSPEVGWKMKQEAGKKQLVLELGGNAGTIVTPSCDLEHAISRILVGGYAYQGQVCIHAQRVFVHHSIMDAFVQGLVPRIRELRYGDPLDPDTDITTMIDEANAIRVETWVQEAVAQGANILCGGYRQGSYYAPTLINQVNYQMRICREEVFGPVVTLEPYQDFSEAIAMVNNSSFGLQAGVFTNQIHEMDQAFAEIQAGGIIINDVPTFRTDHMPYGGIKDSGLGREGVKYAIQHMLEPRLLVKSF